MIILYNSLLKRSAKGYIGFYKRSNRCDISQQLKRLQALPKVIQHPSSNKTEKNSKGYTNILHKYFMTVFMQDKTFGWFLLNSIFLS